MLLGFVAISVDVARLRLLRAEAQVAADAAAITALSQLEDTRRADRATQRAYWTLRRATVGEGFRGTTVEANVSYGSFDFDSALRRRGFSADARRLAAVEVQVNAEASGFDFAALLDRQSSTQAVSAISRAAFEPVEVAVLVDVSRDTNGETPGVREALRAFLVEMRELGVPDDKLSIMPYAGTVDAAPLREINRLGGLIWEDIDDVETCSVDYENWRNAYRFTTVGLPDLFAQDRDTVRWTEEQIQQNSSRTHTYCHLLPANSNSAVYKSCLQWTSYFMFLFDTIHLDDLKDGRTSNLNCASGSPWADVRGNTANGRRFEFGVRTDRVAAIAPSFLRRDFYEAGRNPADAMFEANDLLRDTESARKVVVMLTNGSADCGRLDGLGGAQFMPPNCLEDIRDDADFAARILQANDVDVYAVHYGTTDDADIADDLDFWTRNGGEYIPVRRTWLLEVVMEELAWKIHNVKIVQ